MAGRASQREQAVGAVVGLHRHGVDRAEHRAGGQQARVGSCRRDTRVSVSSHTGASCGARLEDLDEARRRGSAAHPRRARTAGRARTGAPTPGSARRRSTTARQPPHVLGVLARIVAMLRRAAARRRSAVCSARSRRAGCCRGRSNSLRGHRGRRRRLQARSRRGRTRRCRRRTPLVGARLTSSARRFRASPAMPATTRRVRVPAIARLARAAEHDTRADRRGLRPTPTARAGRRRPDDRRCRTAARRPQRLVARRPEHLLIAPGARLQEPLPAAADGRLRRPPR